ncbi:hypothetical protein EDB85DRAFT_2030447, partial [Lactarius pseudohatsudake]
MAAQSRVLKQHAHDVFLFLVVFVRRTRGLHAAESTNRRARVISELSRAEVAAPAKNGRPIVPSPAYSPTPVSVL